MLLKVKAKHLLGHYPGLFYPAYRILAPKRIRKECLLSPKSELVIEGFPRSANTFAVIAFRHAQGRHVPMAHHLHIEAQIIKGAQRGLPVIALIRDPIDAVKSLLIRHPETNIQWAFERYHKFYSGVIHVIDKVTVAPFDIVIKDFGKIIKKVNKQHKTKYLPFIHNKDNVAKVFKEIEKINLSMFKGQESHLSRPSKYKKQKTKNIEINKNMKYVQKALEIYQFIIRSSQ